MANYRGLDELRRELNRGGKELRREVGKAHVQVAERIILPAAKDRMRSAGYKRGGYLGARGISASASATRGRINLSGSNPRTLGEEFGAIRRWGVSFHPWKGNQFTGLDPGQAGYAVQPVIRERQGDILKAMLDGYYDALGKAYPEGG